MAELMKARINADSLGELARRIKEVYPVFKRGVCQRGSGRGVGVASAESPDPEDGACPGQISAGGLHSRGDDS